ncbi:hypothetical protein K1T71_007920 [Dendrolimus kikuchii]|uniref:Uncharacterized protein n=1 Tax=Dendrolimus kikuchii TaxID=765133 RepID=A0ACC1CYS0_9NEOP|nr:hypothetical protein K1T71_007920 [Dendrolimus kikuchii]
MFSRLEFFLSKNNAKQMLTLNEIFKPLYKLLVLFGLFPYNIKYQDNQHQFIIIYKTIYLNGLTAVSINLTICLFVALHIRYIYTSMKDNTLASGIMPNVNYITELLCLVLFSLVTYLCAFLNRYNYVNMLNTLANLLDTTSNRGKVLGALKIEIKIILASLFLFLIMQIVVNFTREDSFFKMILVLFTFNLPQIIQFTSLAFYCVLIDMVVATLITVRLRLVSVMKERSFSKVSLMTVESKLPSISLRQMEVIYIKALGVKREVNKSFQVSILITMLQCFHSMVSESHIIYHGVIVQKSLTTHEIVNCSIWILYQLAKVGALANSGRLLKAEIMRLSQTLYGIPTGKNDVNFFMEIQHFSSLIYCQGTDLTACNFFPLDATLMFKVLSSATMYLIILVQFDKK